MSPTTAPHAAVSFSGDDLKRRIREYWDRTPCGTQEVVGERYSRKYFDDIEELRYSLEPQIFEFAQFSRFRGWKVLEVGVGAATDFLQWARVGAALHGIDLSPVAVEHARRRLPLYDVPPADVQVADAENMPFADNSFDLVYSWGVVHHTPDTAKAVREIVRVTRPGGLCKLMVHHRHSLTSLYVWLKWALFRGRPWKSVDWCFANCVESPGTQAFNTREMLHMLEGLPIRDLEIRALPTRQDRLGGHSLPLRILGEVLTTLLGDGAGFYLTLQFVKTADSAVGDK